MQPTYRASTWSTPASAIAASIARFKDPRSLPEPEARRLAASTPAVVWLNCANDGNESAAFEAVCASLEQSSPLDRLADVPVDDGRVGPIRVLQRRRHDVFRHVVELVRELAVA